MLLLQETSYDQTRLGGLSFNPRHIEFNLAEDCQLALHLGSAPAGFEQWEALQLSSVLTSTG